MAKREQPSVFDYLDYRGFLRDYYVSAKSTDGLSYRSFAKTAKISSPSYLKLVIDGRRNLSSEMAERFAEAIRLRGEERHYFLTLVRFTQAKTSRERNASYAELTGFQRYRSAKPLETAHAAYHSKWYLPAVRELAAARDFRPDPEWIAGRLLPPITAEQAAEALDVLVTLGLLSKDRGRLVQGAELVSTGPETQRLHVVNYHRAMMELAADSMDRVPAEQRDISSLTLCVGAGGLKRIKERLQRFRREILELSVLEDDPRQVVQINFQLFPLSVSTKDEK